MKIKIMNDGIMVSQATKEGFIFCKVGGGIRYGIPDINKEKRESSRGWRYMPGIVRNGTTDGCRVIGIINDPKRIEMHRRIYDPHYVAPCVTCRGGTK